MPRVQRYKLAHKLATVALGGAAMAVAWGQLPAAAYGPPPPPPASTGYRNVVTSQVIGPAGGVITAEIDGLKVAVTIPPGEFTRPVQVVLLSPFLAGIGDGGHPGYRAIGGVGIEFLVNGKPYTATLAKPITVQISGGRIRPGDEVAVWNGSRFVLIGSTEAGGTEDFTTRSAGDFVVLAPSRGRGPEGHRPGRGHGFARPARFTGRADLGEVVLESIFFAPVGADQAGTGVRSAQWLAARGH